ncbi:hypothetical protein MIR68_000862, partial [Amoeboaphelidium protococcarum]
NSLSQDSSWSNLILGMRGSDISSNYSKVKVQLLNEYANRKHMSGGDNGEDNGSKSSNKANLSKKSMQKSHKSGKSQSVFCFDCGKQGLKRGHDNCTGEPFAYKDSMKDQKSSSSEKADSNKLALKLREYEQENKALEAKLKKYKSRVKQQSSSSSKRSYYMTLKGVAEQSTDECDFEVLAADLSNLEYSSSESSSESICDDNVSFIIDPGSSNATVNDKSLFIEFKQKQIAVSTMNGTVSCDGIGKVIVGEDLQLSNCLLIPDAENLIGVSPIDRAGKYVLFGNGRCVILGGSSMLKSLSLSVSEYDHTRL